RGPRFAAPTTGSPRRSPSSFLRPSNQVRVEMVLKGAQNVAKRRELLRRQGIGEMPLDRPHVRGGRPPEDARAFGGQRDLGAAAVGGAVVPPYQPPPLHPAEVVGQPAPLPIDGPGELRGSHPLSVRLGQGEEDLVVGGG